MHATCRQLAEGEEEGEEGSSDPTANADDEMAEETDLMAALKVRSLASTPSLAISSSRDRLACTCLI